MVMKSAECKDEKGRHQCFVAKADLHNAAALQFEAAQVLRKFGQLKVSLPLFAAACANFAIMGNPSNALLIWDIGMELQREGMHQEATLFYAALRACEGCSPFHPHSAMLGERLLKVAEDSTLRPGCAGDSGDSPPRNRVRGGASAAEARRAAWAAELPEFCPVIDFSASRHGPQQFLDDFIMGSRPVVLRNLPPLSEPFRPGDALFKGLLDKHGDDVVTAWAAPHGKFWAAEDAETGGPARPARPAEVPLKLKDLVALLQKNASALGAFVYGEHLNLDREVPKLATELVQAQQSGHQLLAALPLRRVNLWLAPMEEEFQDTLHWGGYDSLSYQLECGKEFLLFPPGDADKLPYDLEDGDFGEQTALQWHANVLGAGASTQVKWHLDRTMKSVHAAAAVDLSSPNFTAFPKLGSVLPPKKCTVKAGDALFLPAFWHRQVHFFGGADAIGSGGRCKCINTGVDFWFRPLHSDQTAAEAAYSSIARYSEL